MFHLFPTILFLFTMNFNLGDSYEEWITQQVEMIVDSIPVLSPEISQQFVQNLPNYQLTLLDLVNYESLDFQTKERIVALGIKFNLVRLRPMSWRPASSLVSLPSKNCPVLAPTQPDVTTQPEYPSQEDPITISSQHSQPTNPSTLSTSSWIPASPHTISSRKTSAFSPIQHAQSMFKVPPLLPEEPLLATYHPFSSLTTLDQKDPKNIDEFSVLNRNSHLSLQDENPQYSESLPELSVMTLVESIPEKNSMNPSSSNNTDCPSFTSAETVYPFLDTTDIVSSNLATYSLD